MISSRLFVGETKVDESGFRFKVLLKIRMVRLKAEDYQVNLSPWSSVFDLSFYLQPNGLQSINLILFIPSIPVNVAFDFLGTLSVFG